jgi:hypothetical protein
MDIIQVKINKRDQRGHLNNVSWKVPGADGSLPNQLTHTPILKTSFVNIITQIREDVKVSGLLFESLAEMPK